MNSVEVGENLLSFAAALLHPAGDSDSDFSRDVVGDKRPDLDPFTLPAAHYRAEPNEFKIRTWMAPTTDTDARIVTSPVSRLDDQGDRGSSRRMPKCGLFS